jgi:hypothetical protein
VDAMLIQGKERSEAAESLDRRSPCAKAIAAIASDKILTGLFVKSRGGYPCVRTSARP